MFPGAGLPPGFYLRDQMPIMLVHQSGSSHAAQVDRPDVFAEPTHTYVYVTRRVDTENEHARAMALVIAFHGRRKQWVFSSLDYLNPTHAQWVGARARQSSK
jgi:hypothetical protein